MALANRQSERTANEDLREVRDFYELRADTLWITFAGDQLVGRRRHRHAHTPKAGESRAARWRTTLRPRRSTNIAGNPLRIDRLTTTRSYRRTICEVQARDYLIRKINGQSEPVVDRATTAQGEAIEAAQALFASLDHSDFELLTDLIFAAGGWRRVSVVGETMKDADLVLEQPVTRECAFMQVKSRATQRRLNDCEERCRSYGDAFDRMFFVPFAVPGAGLGGGGCVLAGAELAVQAVSAGLLDRLIERNQQGAELEEQANRPQQWPE